MQLGRPIVRATKRGTAPWQIEAARFCAERESFTQAEFFEYAKTLGVSESAASRFFGDNIRHPPGNKFDRGDDTGQWFAPLELVSVVVDHDELKEARKNALNAWRWAVASFVVALIAGIAQILQLGKS